MVGKILIELVVEEASTQDLAERVGVSFEALRYAITILQLMGVVKSLAIVKQEGRDDIIWVLTEHAQSHHEGWTRCPACSLREKLLWGGIPLE